ncbi:carbohydrate kinase [Phycisphaerales bacterium AB-hyl4]|uniref:Carbohydrate kinase n=1 Tax=Natronomicrosphaera hydrolytica TaxID=3242702 RepID=A0ABV4U2P0_9BACT
MTRERFTIVGIGEALFDLFPESQRLGGAPLNVALHAHQLAQVRQGRGVPVSRVGQDELGQLLIDQVKERGVTTEFIQTDPDKPTGTVYVDFDADGQPTFDIVQNVAWDVLSFDFDLEDLARTCAAVAFGTLAQRDAQARNSIYRFLDTARQAVRLFDVNLRQNFYDARMLRRSCELATVLKLNEHELPAIAREIYLDAADDADAMAAALMKQFKFDMIVLTRGKQGTRLYTPQGTVDGEPAEYPVADDADPVGAGDSVAAAVLVGRVLRMNPQKIANLANHVGAYVAGQPGATPTLPDEILAMVKA